MTQGSSAAREIAPGVNITAPITPAFETILTPEAMAFVASLERQFGERRRALLTARAARQAHLDAGETPDFLPETAHIREGDWRVAPLPPALRDRRVEITGPTDRKMVINALNSGARCFMADLEDSNAPTWDNMIQGQINLRDAAAGDITHEDPATGKRYALGDSPATLLVRPRGWHLEERHILVDGRPCAGAIVDFGLHFFHNASVCAARGTGPFYYLPKMESHREAALWNDIFVAAQDMLDIPQGTIRATVLIETILAAFEMDEILHALRDHSAGLNCGRWDYIFSIIKKFRGRADFVMPDRGQVTMTSPCMRAYSLLAIRTCHRRGAPCIGGMAAQIPVKDDPAANEAAFAAVAADKAREANDGHDGTWVAHPGLVPVAMKAFDAVMDTPNQIHRARDDVSVTAADLLAVPGGTITADGLRTNVRVGILYLEAWLGGNGCVPLFNLMEDAATAEISRAQLWQWRRHAARDADGAAVTAKRLDGLIDDAVAEIRAVREPDGAAHLDRAVGLFRAMVGGDDFPDFLTLPAYDMLLED